MDKKLKKFYKEIEDVLLFPGSLVELNEQEKARSSEIIYDFLPKGPRYITGVLFPMRADISLYAVAFSMLNKIEAKFPGGHLNGAYVYVGPLKATFETPAGLNNLTESIEEILVNLCPQDLLDLDIRLRAKKIGAQGLVHFQIYDVDRAYMGIPIKQIKVESKS